MHPVEIKAALQMATPPCRQVDIADQCDVTPTTVHDVIHGRRRCKRVEHRIALTLNKQLGDIWPQWYCGNVRPSRRRNVASSALAAVGV